MGVRGLPIRTITFKDISRNCRHPVTAHTHTHTHNRFMALFDFVQDYPGELAPER